MKRGIWACLLVCSSAFAQESVHLRYVAPPECPSERQFQELVRARLLGDPRANEAALSESGSAVNVEVRLDPAHQRGTLLLQEPNLAPVERVVAGETCEELVSGLALITALAFGAGRESSPLTEPSRTTEPRAVVAPAASASASSQAAPRSAPAPPTPSVRAHSDASTPITNSTPLAIELGAGGWTTSWWDPSGMWGADLFVGVAPKDRRTWSVRAAGLYGFGSSRAGDREADFRFFGGRVEGCAFSRSFYRGRLVIEPCLALELGALRGSGQDASALLEGASDTAFAATAAFTGRFRFRIVKGIFSEFQAYLGVPLVHHEFVFEEPREQIFRIPSFGTSARLGLGVQFL